jgi:hypothetical protein
VALRGTYPAPNSESLCECITMGMSCNQEDAYDINELRPYTMDKHIMLDYLEEGCIRLDDADLRDLDMPLTLYVMICYTSSWVWHKQRGDVYDADYIDVSCMHTSIGGFKSTCARLSGNIRRIMAGRRLR